VKVKRNIIIGTCAAVLAAAGATYAFMLPDTEEKFLQACDETLKDRLVAPATYARANVTGPVRRGAEMRDYLDQQTAEKREWREVMAKRDKALAELYREKVKAFRFGAFEVVSYFIEYDAANSFGTPLRSTAECSQIVETGAPLADPGFGRDAVIDGFTAFDWTFFQLWKARGG